MEIKSSSIGGVTSINSLTGAVTLAAGSNITLTPSGNTITIASTGGFVNPMTTLGDIIYENATPAAARLAGNISTTKTFLTQTGNGVASAAPVWTDLFGSINSWVGIQHFRSSLDVGVASSATGFVRFYNNTNSNDVTIVSGVTSGGYNLTLPLAQGGADTFLKNNGSGVLSWASVGSGDVVGPGSATNNAFPIYDGVTGKLLKDQNSVVYGNGTSFFLGVNMNDNSISGLRINNNVGTPGDFLTFVDMNTGGTPTRFEVNGYGNLIKINSVTYNWPGSQGAASTVLQNDGSGNLSWATAATGDVVGPSGATDNAIARYDGTSGKLIQNSAVTIDDSGNIGTGTWQGTAIAATYIGDLSAVYATLAYVTIANAEANSGITPVADGTYTVGIGSITNGTITTVKGIITAVQQAS